jgi:hypothetical protein
MPHLSGSRLQAKLVLLAHVAAAGAAAQVPALATGPYEFGLSVTLQSPRDVNQPPHCQRLALPCTSPRTFPDFGVGLLAATFRRERIGLAAELGGFANKWRSSTTADGRETNAVQFAVAGPIVRSPLFSYGTAKPTFVRVFGQVMGGLLSSTLASTQSVVQAGFGADGHVDRSLWFRLQFDYRVASSGPRNLSGGRALFALVAKP